MTQPSGSTVSGALINTFNVQGGNGTGGTDNIALGADGCTLYYDGEGTQILRYNVCTGTQLSDFADGVPGYCFAMAVRPNGDLMVACSSQVNRFNAAGTLVQTYPNPNGSQLFALNLDPDNSTFWTGDDENGEVFHININTGALIGSFPSNPNSGLFGLAVVGQITVATQDPTTTAVSCSPNPVTVGSPTSCKATVTDTASSGATTPTGTVTFSSNGSGAFGSGGTCTLSGSGNTASCTVTYTPSASGTQTITAAYGGDSGHLPSSGTTQLQVTSATTDTTPPSCTLTGVIAGPPKQIQITAQDSGSGLRSIVVTSSSNATTSVPPFTPGTTSPVVVTATKINQSAGSTVALQVTDVAGNVTNCDPALIGLRHHKAMAQRIRVRHLSAAESTITIVNGKPGIRRILIAVNGKIVKSVILRAGQHETVSVAGAMRASGGNTIALTMMGKAGGGATVAIHN